MLSTCKNWCRFHVSKLWTWMKPTSSFLSLLVSNLIHTVHTVPVSLNASVCFIESDRWALTCPSEDLQGRSTYHKLVHHFIYFQVLSHPRHSDMDSKPLLGKCWFNLSGGLKPLPIRISLPGSIGNLYHGSCGRGGMAGLPVPSGNLGGFCWIRAANWRSSCFTINIKNHKPCNNHVRSTIINHFINLSNHQSRSLKSNQTTRVI